MVKNKIKNRLKENSICMINIMSKKQPKEFFSKLGLKKSLDMNNNMTKSNQKNFFLN